MQIAQIEEKCFFVVAVLEQKQEPRREGVALNVNFRMIQITNKENISRKKNLLVLRKVFVLFLSRTK